MDKKSTFKTERFDEYTVSPHVKCSHVTVDDIPSRSIRITVYDEFEGGSSSVNISVNEVATLMDILQHIKGKIS